ncbi:MAG: hypothetical protein LQ343_003758 [Gyalolechia ehrenbergii]|nr:MAG: hypothetical protein LQ343_003758 [Gyalolechia ehrenbergii]
MYSIPIRRSFGALLALILSALLFSSWNNGSARRLAKRQPLVENSLIPNSSSATNVSHFHGRHHIPLKHSDLHTSHIIQKRARTLSYHDAVCKGRLLSGQILEVHEGKRTPGREFGVSDIQNGWSRQEFPRPIPATFDEPFKAIGRTLPNIGERIPETSETHLVDLVQDKPFRNSAGKKQNPIPLKGNAGAHYEVYYIPLWNAMISSDTRSPRYQVQVNADFKISSNNINKLVPPLNRQSDAMWAVWKTISRTPNDLRYIGRNGIINDDTKGIMNDIFSKGPTGQPVRWPGLTFGIDTEEGQALLGTPNGLAVAYILMDRAKELGRRKVSVTIAASADPSEPGLGFRMLWDMEPPSAPTLTLSLPPPGLGLTFESKTPSTTRPLST